jgi:GxxExxY protein
MINLTESDPRTYAIIGAAIEVHRHLGCGFLEPVYQEALEMEFVKRAIPHNAQHKYTKMYKATVGFSRS